MENTSDVGEGVSDAPAEFVPITMEKFEVDDRPHGSVTLSAKLNVPAAVGVPER
jgi:hypothetical protein